MPRVPNQSHEMNWVNAIKGTDTISCPFSYAAHLTEIMLLGVAAMRAGTRLQYDGAAMRVTNHAAANSFLSREYQKGIRARVSARLRVLVAGCGQMGASHARAYQRMPADFEIVGLVSRGAGVAPPAQRVSRRQAAGIQ